MHEYPVSLCGRGADESLTCSLEEIDALKDNNYQGDIENTPFATSSSRTYKAHSSPSEALSSKFSGWMFKKEEEQKRTRRLQEDKRKFMGLMHEPWGTGNPKSTRHLITMLLADITEGLEESFKNVEEIRTGLESLDSKAHR